MTPLQVTQDIRNSLELINHHSTIENFLSLSYEILFASHYKSEIRGSNVFCNETKKLGGTQGTHVRVYYVSV